MLTHFHRTPLAVTLAAVALAGAASAQNDPLIQVDIQSPGDPTFQAEGFPAWGALEPGNLDPGESFSQTFGSIDVTFTPTLGPDNGPEFSPPLDGFLRFTDFGEGADLFLEDLHADFVSLQRNTAVGLGQSALKLDLGGLDPNSVVRVRVFSYDPNNPSTGFTTSAMAWSAVDPGPFGNYQPASIDLDSTPDVDETGLYKNPVPLLQRSIASGPWPADPVLDDPLAYTATFTLPVDAEGNTSFYGWADALTFATNLNAIVNGFELFTQLRGDMNFDDVVDENDADLFNAVVAGNAPMLSGLTQDVLGNDIPEFLGAVGGVNTQAQGFNAAADMNGDGVLDQADVDLFNALVGGGGLVGDINNDGFVGAGDLDVLLGVWNQTLADSVADLNDDGFIGAGDLDILLGNWNAGTPPSGSAGVAPEPASLALMSLGVVAVLRRRR